MEHLFGEDGHSPRIEWGSEGQMNGEDSHGADVERNNDSLYAECPVKRNGEAERGDSSKGRDERHTLQAS